MIDPTGFGVFVVGTQQQQQQQQSSVQRSSVSHTIMSSLGQLSLLTPITSPMVTRPTSPSAAAKKANTFEETFPTDPAAAPDAAASAVAAAEEGLRAAGALPAAAAACTEPIIADNTSSSAVQLSKGAAASPLRPAKKWKSPPCCDGCGAAKASGGQCSGCHGRFCPCCMGHRPSPATASGDATGAASSLCRAGSSGGGSSSQARAAKDPCNNCHSLCNTCKPVACCFCEELRQQARAVKLCEACAGVCNACQRAACGLCRVAFSCCKSCGYAVCEDCRLQLQLQSGSATLGSGLVGPAGTTSCWCAPPLRMASNIRHVSSQRFQMAQLHPSFLACSMEAAGLRDADYDEDDVSYGEEEDDIIMAQLAMTDGDQDANAQQDLHASAAAGKSGGLGLRQGSLGLSSTLCAKDLEATIGSLPGYGGGHLSLPLSPSSSTHSSMGQYGTTPGGGAPAAGAGLAGLLGYSSHHLRHPEHTLRGWLDGGN